MSKIKDFKELIVWQKSMDLLTLIYLETRNFPKEEIYGLRSQIRRAAVSVPANIAEGWGRRTTLQYLHFLGIARGSMLELETEIIGAGRLELIMTEVLEKLSESINEVNRILNGLIKSLENKLPPRSG